ncbi:hypothetical protein HID58_086177, partial [Brassica napus]
MLFPFYVLTVTQEAFWKLGKPAQAFCLSFSYLSNPELIFLTMELAKPHHFSMNNKDIHRFTDHQFTISFSHNSVLSAANCLRDMECQEEVDIPKAFVNPGGDFGIVPAQLVLINIEKSRRVQVRPRSFTRKGNSSQFNRSKLLTLSLRICLCLFSSILINQDDGRSPRRSASPNKVCVTDVAASFESL